MNEKDDVVLKKYTSGQSGELTEVYVAEGVIALKQWFDRDDQCCRIVYLEPGDIGTIYRALVKRGLIGDYPAREEES